MAELVVGRSKPCAERRELISTGRVEPVGRGEWMLPGPLQSSAPSSPKPPPMLSPMVPDRLPDGFGSMMARVMSSANAAWDEYMNIPRRSSQEGSMLSVPPPQTPSPRSTPQPSTKMPSPVAGDRERTETAAVFARIDANFREYVAECSSMLRGEISQVCRSVGGLEVRMSCLEASRRSASSDLSDGARGGKIVADPPSPKPDPDRVGSESRRARTIHPAPHVADPCLKSIVEVIPPPHIHHTGGLRLKWEPPEGLREEYGPATHRPRSVLEPDCMSRLPEPPLVRRTPVRADFGQATPGTVPPPFPESMGIG